MKCNKRLKYSNYVAFSHFHGTAVNNSGLTIWKKNEYAGNLNIWKRKEGVLHSYKGMMKISGDKMKSKLYLGVYLEKQEAWCSERTAFAICLCFCVLASMVFLCCPETCLNKVKENG